MLTSNEVELLRALVNRIIPADADPAGWEAGVGDYLFAQFERDLKDQLAVYRAGLPDLDTEAEAFYGRCFVSLHPSEQDALLTRIEAGKVLTTWAVNPQAFLRMAINHCAEGYYSNPENGGNKDGISWAMIGFEVTG